MGPVVRWIPAVLFAAAACSETNIVGSKFIKTQAIIAAQGGTITVSSLDDPNLVNLTIIIPPNALASDTTITIAEAAVLSTSQLGGATQDGTTADLGPSGTRFSRSATVIFPFAADAGSDVSVIGVEDDGTVITIADGGLSIDALAGLVTFPVTGFTRYAAVHRPQCPAGFMPCGSDAGASCVDPLLDPNNCGECGNACPSGESCDGGDCRCFLPLTLCPTEAGMVCTNTGSDPLNCGSCSVQCPPNEICSSNVCACILSLTIGQCATDAGLSCVDLQTDNGNCGGCGNQCADNQHCAAPGGGAGGCVCDEPDAGPPVIDNCNGTCVDTSSDPANCGGCGSICVSRSCIPGDSGTGICACPLPYTQCGPICVDTFGDVNHCGSCENDCYIVGLAEVTCNLGHCYCGPTGTGTICPDGTCATLDNDPSNCGSCGYVCMAPATECVNSTCSCPGAETLCGSPDAGIPLFCVNTTLDPANCGVCGNVCNDTYAIGSVCGFGLCGCASPTPYLCGVAGSGQCLPKQTECDAGMNTLPDGG